MQSTVAVRCLFGLALLLTVTAISSAQSVSFKEFPIPNANYLNFIAAGPDGAVWFTDTYGDKIGRVTTDGTITEFQMPITGSYPAGITGGPDGAVWFTESGGNRIGRITADGNIREFPIPPPFGQIWSITTGPDGALWFTDYTNRKIGRIKTDGAITEYQIPNPTTYPWDITSGPDGALWFADLHGNKIGRITTTGDITEFPLAPTNYSFGPQGITSGPDGALWFVGYDSQVGRITTTGNIIEFQLPTANVHAPWSIAQGPDGALWFSAANNIDRISTTGAITEFPIPTANPWATDIAATPDGALWFLELEARKIGRLTIASPVTITSVSLPIGVLGTPYSAPTLQASGGTTPYTWTATGLPPGMSINSAGMVSGTPTSLGTFNPTITATDSSIPTQTAQKVFPIQIVSSTASITVTTNPAGLQIVVDGNMVTSPRSFVWDVGSGHSIGVLSPQGSGGTRSVFTVWSDNGAQTHNVTTPATTATYTANFKTQNLLTTAVSPPGTGTVSANPPSADGFYDNSTTVVLTASGLFLNWSGDLSGSANPQPLAMTVPRLVTATFNAVSITEYPLPLFGSSPTGITEGPDGALWFAEGNGNKIGRITTVGTITEFPIPTAASGPNYIAAGPDGSLWFAEAGVGKIGRITTDGNITEFHISAAPYGIAAGPDGALWFVETGASKIGRITTTGDITESLIPTADSFPLDIAKGPDGALWFTENRGNKIGRISVTGDITEFLIPSSGSSPQGITAGSDGALWFIENRGNKIGRVATDGTINEFLIPTAGSFPLEIAAGPDGALWFTENGGNKIGRITTAGTITEFPVPTFGSYLWGITAGTDGAMWFTEGNGNQIGRIAIASPVAITTVSLPYGVFNTPYSTTTLQAAGGSPPYTWAATDLPSGLTLSTSGVLSGTPISIGIFSPTIVATDISVTPQVAQSILNVTVVPRLSITSGCPGSPFTIGTLFSYSLAAAGGTGTYLWSISTGSLPGGLGIDGSTIGGIVTAPTGTFNFTIQASSGSQSASLSCSLTVLNPTTGISVVTSPAGLQMIVDGITMTSPQNFIWVVGSSGWNQICIHWLER
jgi:streptogramin lyase